MMRDFAHAHPDVELTLDVGNRAHVIESVLRHGADVAISGTPPGDERLLSEPLSENRIVCITSPEDPATLGRPHAAAELAGRPWLLREQGSGTRALNEQFLADRGLAPRVLELGSNGAIKQAARAGLGISLLSRDAVEVELATGQLGEIPLRDAPRSRPWYVLRSSVGPSRPVVAELLAHLRARYAAGSGAGAG
jgi:DNA-binding transcriptional LysR family regulator